MASTVSLLANAPVARVERNISLDYVERAARPGNPHCRFSEFSLNQNCDLSFRNFAGFGTRSGYFATGAQGSNWTAAMATVAGQNVGSIFPRTKVRKGGNVGNLSKGTSFTRKPTLATDRLKANRIADPDKMVWRSRR